MRFYINILTYYPDLDPPYEVYYQQILEQIELAEELGWECFMFNEHHFLGYGGLVANPATSTTGETSREILLRWVEQYFDAFLYFANWGSRRFMLRLPKKLRWRGSERRSLWEKSSGRWCHEGGRGRGVMSPRRRAEKKGKRRQAGFGASIKSHGTAQGTHKKKVTLARVRKLPLWLRRLDRVKAELKGTRFPRTAEEGFRQCVALSTTSLRWLRDSIRKSHPKASEEQLETEKRRLLARLSPAESRWLVAWRKERARYFR
jgi:hypothetical protein